MTIVESQPEVAPPPGGPSEHRLMLSDGMELFYRAWLPARPRAGLVLFHRGHEHSGRFADFVAALELPDLAVFAWDARGHGCSPGDRGWAPSFGTVVRDVDEFVRHITKAHGLAMDKLVILGHSVGAVAVATWVHDYAPPVRAMVLVAPALRVKLYIPLAVPGLRVMHAWKRGRKAFIKSYVRAKMLTHDPEQAQAYDRDPLIARSIAVNILLGLHDTSTRLIDDAGAIRTPTLLLAAGADWVVHLRAQRRFFARLGSPTKRMHVFPGMYHDILHEKDRRAPIDQIRGFIREALDADLRPAPPLDADQRGYSKSVYDRLLAPAKLGPKSLAFAAQKGFMKTVGRLSKGIRIGWRSGFDSGQSLDYVYENRACGALGLGRLIDRVYLNSPGWSGVRQRRVHLRELLHEAIGRLAGRGRAVRIVDIASGPGRYVLEAAAAHPPGTVGVLLRDLNPANLDAARELAKQLGVAEAAFECADAFDRHSLAAIRPAPSVAIVSGLYELFPDNGPVRTSLAGLAEALRGGGYLLYTGQPWHPQLEMIARVLRNREGRPWIMRRRTQEELDALVQAAGFEKVAMRIGELGIFTVSLARIGDVP